MTKNYFFINKPGNILVRVNYDDVYGIKADGDYVYICICTPTLSGGLKSHHYHSTLLNIENIFPKDRFFRCHRTWVINVDKINEIRANEAVTAYEAIPIGEQYRKPLLNMVNYLKSTTETKKEETVLS